MSKEDLVKLQTYIEKATKEGQALSEKRKDLSELSRQGQRRYKKKLAKIAAEPAENKPSLVECKPCSSGRADKAPVPAVRKAIPNKEVPEAKPSRPVNKRARESSDEPAAHQEVKQSRKSYNDDRDEHRSAVGGSWSSNQRGYEDRSRRGGYSGGRGGRGSWRSGGYRGARYDRSAGPRYNDRDRDRDDSHGGYREHTRGRRSDYYRR